MDNIDMDSPPPGSFTLHCRGYCCDHAVCPEKVVSKQIYIYILSRRIVLQGLL